MKKVPKVVVIGLDAATWTLIRPLVAEGKMPNLAKLMKAGVSGPLQSIMPPITPPAWTSFMTGKNPGKHGIYNFIKSEQGSYAMKYANATSRRAPTVWKLLNDAGYTVGTMNVPFTYPPEKLNGFQISGMDTPSESSPFIHPPELRDELIKNLGAIQHDVRFLGAMSTDERRNQVLAEMEELDRQWSKAALYLLEHHPQDVMMFVFMSIDTVQHHFWHHMDKEHFLHDPARAPKFGDAVRKVYERLDTATGQIIDRLPPETAVFVVSDHGGGPTVDRTIYLNRYLAQLGLLHYKGNTVSPLRKLGQKMLRASFSALRGTLTSRQKTKLAELFPKLREKSELAYSSFTDIDWTRTKAYCSEVLASPPSIRINLKGVKPQGIVEPAEYESLITSIIEKLADLRDPRTGKPVINRVYRRHEVFQGPFADEGADLILDWWSENSLFSTEPSFPEHTNEPALIIREHLPQERTEWGGTHRLYGIVIAGGPAFKSGAEIANARLIDIAPTLLDLAGYEIPETMQGKSLVAGLEKKTCGPGDDEGEKEIHNRLAGLGYV